MQNVQVLKITRTKEILFSVVFTALAVYTPMLVHYFGGVNAGRKFLPMPFFVLLAGLTLGWRARLATGLFSPIISFLISGMPVLGILPILIIQLCAYGFFAGILREKYSVLFSLAGAIIFGLILTGLAVSLFSKMNAVLFIARAARDGWLGILAQIILIPLLIKILALVSQKD